MEDRTAPENQTLTWPTLNHDFDEPTVDIEHIEITANIDTMDELLFEIEIIHPHVSKKLKLLIGHPEFELEMKRLIMGDRENREGFSQFVIDHLLKIYEIHIEKYGHLSPVNINVWELNRS